MALERAKCPECQRVLAVQPPAGGDGSIEVFPRHYYLIVSLSPGGSRGEPCPMGRAEVNPEDYVDAD